MAATPIASSERGVLGGKDNGVLSLTELSKTLNASFVSAGLATSGFADGQVVFFPNPVEDRLTVRFNLEGQGEASIALYDVLGNDTKFRKQCDLSTVNNTCQLSLGGFRNGVYIAKISYTNQGTKDTKVGYFRVTVSH